MTDNRVQAYAYLRKQARRHRLHAMQATRLEATLARSYSDDIDVRSGALSAPHEHPRPGTRDDVRCSFSGLPAAI